MIELTELRERVEKLEKRIIANEQENKFKKLRQLFLDLVENAYQEGVTAERQKRADWDQSGARSYACHFADHTLYEMVVAEAEAAAREAKGREASTRIPASTGNNDRSASGRKDI